jgi:hypothetical protein
MAHATIGAVDERVSRLIEVERFHRELGLLDGGFRFSPEDYLLVDAVLSGGVDRHSLPVGIGWLADLASRLDEPHPSCEIDLLASLSSNVVGWYADDYGDWDALLWKLASASGGAFDLERLSVVHVDTAGDDCFVEVEALVAGRRRYLALPHAEYSHQRELCVELNRWLGDHPKCFYQVAEHWICVDEEQRHRLVERGLQLELCTVWKVQPVELVPLAEHYVTSGQLERAVDVGTFHPELAARASGLSYYAGLALLGLGRDEEGWAEITRAAANGKPDALVHARAWRAARG